MDYKYIEQLLERYWRGETSLQEEEILRSFFDQEDVPESLRPYQSLFSYESHEKEADKLGDDFDEKMMALIGEDKPVKAVTVKLSQRLRPLFKAAAVVAIVITLGNAMQMAFQAEQPVPTENVAGINRTHQGPSVAQTDSAKVDSMKTAAQTGLILK